MNFGWGWWGRRWTVRAADLIIAPVAVLSSTAVLAALLENVREWCSGVAIGLVRVVVMVALLRPGRRRRRRRCCRTAAAVDFIVAAEAILGPAAVVATALEAVRERRP